MKRIIKIVLPILFIIGIGITLTGCSNKKQDSTYRVVTSFYPLYIMTLNITSGAQQMELSNMSDVRSGCIHDYTLTTADLKKLETADLFIENGLGLESFHDKILQTYPDMQVLDSSGSVENFIKENEQINPHIWTSTINYIKQINRITEKLIEQNPENRQIYEQNAEEYIAKINRLKSSYDEKLALLNGEYVVILNESFTYLAKELGLKTIVIPTNHEESTLSAEVVSSTIETMKQYHITKIIIDKEDDTRNAQLLAQETGAKIYALDSGVTGSLNKDSYLSAMRGNFEKLIGEEK